MLNDHTSMQNTHAYTCLGSTHLHKHFQQESQTQFLFCMPSAHSRVLGCLPPPNGSLRLQKGRNASFPPAASVWEDFYGNLELDFLCNLYACVIFSDPIEFAASSLFLFEQGRAKGREEGKKTQRLERVCMCV